MRVTLLENFRAVFYAPFYAALALGLYEEEGVEVRLEQSPDPAQTANLLMSGGARVSWGGPMRVMAAYDRAPGCDLKIFCEVVRRDPFFLIGKEPNPAFRMRDLTDGKIAVVSEVPTPWLCLQRDLRLAGLDPEALNGITDRTMAENAAALRAGEVDVVQAFQPLAEELIEEGAGHLWYAAAERGLTTYTALYARAAFLREAPEAALAMTKAMRGAGRWLAGRGAEEVARRVRPWFEDVPFELLARAIARYQQLGLWNESPRLARGSFEWLRAACLSGGLIKTGVSYERAVDMRFADAVA